jgi:hypothetical protein
MPLLSSRFTAAMKRTRVVAFAALLAAAGLLFLLWPGSRDEPPVAATPSRTTGRIEFPAPPQPSAAEAILEGYGDPSSPPVEDLRKIHRVITGYFSVVKDGSRNPIGGNPDLASALRGDNPNHEVFVREGHPIFGLDGMIIDRWGSSIVVHPEAYRQLGLRSAGPDRSPYTADDLVLSPSGVPMRAN